METLRRIYDRSFSRFVQINVLGLIFVAASAQGRSPALTEAPTTLLGIVAHESQSENIVLTFSSAAPRFDVVPVGASEVQIVLHDVAVRPNVAIDNETHDINIALSQHVNEVSITLTSPASLTISTQTTDHSITLVRVSQPGAARAETTPISELPLSTRRTATIFRLRYADVSEVAGILVPGSTVVPDDVFLPQASNFGQSQSAGGPNLISPMASENGLSADALGRASLPLGQRVSDAIAIDRRMNAIIVIGTPDETAAVKQVIDLVDVPLTTVLMEVEVVELTDNAARNVGFDFSPNGTLGSATLQSETFNLPAAILTLQANIYAQVIKGEGKVIAKPRISTLDGKAAMILTGDAVPIITTLSYPSAGAPFVQQQVQYINVGVSLQIRPQISPDDVVTAHIFAEVSSVTGYVSANIPTISQRQASTIVTVPDGQTVVLGGLVTENEIKSVTRIPFLSNLPLLGSLFKLVNDSHQRSNLYLLITPHVIHPGQTPSPLPPNQ